MFERNGLNIRRAIAKSKLAEAWIQYNTLRGNDSILSIYLSIDNFQWWISEAHKTAHEIADYENTCLIAANMKRIKVLAKEQEILRDYKVYDSFFRYWMKNCLGKHEELLQIFEEGYGKDHVVVSSMHTNIGRINRYLAQHEISCKNFDEAKTLYKNAKKSVWQSMKIQEKVLMKKDKRRVENYHLMASLHMETFGLMGGLTHLKKAEKLFFKSIELKRDFLGEHECDLGSDYQGLYDLYERLGKKEEKVKIQEQLMNWKEVQREIKLSERAQQCNCLECPDFSCINCFSCMCQTKYVTKKIGQEMNVHRILQTIYNEKVKYATRLYDQ